MAIKEFIENHAVFTTTELFDAVGDSQTNRNLLSTACKSDKVQKVRNNVYVSNTGRYRAHEVLPFEIANKMVEDATFCYISALDLHFGLQNINHAINVYSKSVIKDIVFQASTYQFYSLPKIIETKKVILDNGALLTVTTKEQTIVDCLEKPDRAGGVECIFRSLSMMNFLDASHAVDLALTRSKSTVAKLGWVLEAKQYDWGVPDSELKRLKDYLSSGPYYFVPGLQQAESYWNASWKLYLPDTQENMERWINE